MDIFRLAIMGAGRIAVKFCDAARRVAGCEIVAVASKSLERARRFAMEERIAAFYGDYGEMLDVERPDCVYVATTVDAHYALTHLCVSRGIAVLCEKAMVCNAAQAEEIFALAREKNIFVMEGLWSRFLPAVQQAKKWLETGRIGNIAYCEVAIGFVAPEDASNRYFNRALGGGAAYDLTVYAYSLATYFLGRHPEGVQTACVMGETGVDETNHVTLRYPHALASLTGSLRVPLKERLELFSPKGRIFLPHPHYADCAYLYGKDGTLIEAYRDEKTENGFVYELEEVIRCIREGKIQSEIMPHADTIACARILEELAKCQKA